MNTTQSARLSLRGIRKSFGLTEVLHGIDMDVFPGEVVALLGENGAGKSTVSNIISGAILPSTGHMLWQGEPYAPVNPREALDTGIGMIHQELMLLPHLSIAENVFLGRYPTRFGCVNRRAMEQQAQLGLERLGLDISPRTLVQGLSTANQQLIEIAKALTLNASLLILDEPTAALGSDETRLLFKQIDRLKSDGVSILYISHRLEEIKKVADRVIVLRDGHKVTEFDSADVPIRTIVEAMVGRTMEQMFPALPQPQDRPVLSVENMNSPSRRFENISFSVREGEIFGIAGLVGSGRTELVRAIAGVDPVASGTITLDGLTLSISSPNDAIQHGIVLVPEDRKLHGLVLEHAINENIAYANLDSVSRSGWIIRRLLNTFANEQINTFGVKGQGHQNANEMSGGNQQKVVIAKWLARKPRIVLLDEPTRGIDVGARSSIYELIQALASEGVAVVVVSSDLEEVLGVSNRIMVMAAGRAAGILNHDEANDISVMELATAS